MATEGKAAVTEGAAATNASGRGRSAAGTVLLALAAGQSLMILDSLVTNVSIAATAEDVGTTAAGIQMIAMRA